MEEWKKYKLSDICDLIAGFAFKSVDFGTEGVSVVKIKDIQPPFVNLDDADKVNLTAYDTVKLKKFLISKGDFLLAMTGATIGKIGKYISNEQSYLNQRVLKFLPKQQVDSKFVYYSLLTNAFQLYILNHIDSDSAQPNISANTIGKYELSIPCIRTQKRIADILSSLDDKIELNRRINDNLEQQAQALYKSWFVDFEPFREGEFVDSELGMIPKGWRVVSLGEVTKQITEKVGNREDVTVLSPINSGELVLSEEYFTKQVFSKDLSKYLIVNPLSFAYNPARINIGSIGLNTFNFVGCVSPAYVVFECEPNYQYFFDFFKRTATFKDEVALRSIGGVRQSLGYNDLSLIKTIYPTPDVVVEFNNLYLKMKEVMIKNTAQNEKIISLRDSLLPKLMSGELKINDLNS